MTMEMITANQLLKVGSEINFVSSKMLKKSISRLMAINTNPMEISIHETLYRVRLINPTAITVAPKLENHR